MNKATARRVEQLCEVSRELERLGPMYLAMLLLQETYARETLEQLVYGNGNVEVALQAAIARARRILTRPELAELPVQIDLGERIKLKAEGKPLPDKRRRAKAVT